MLLCGDEHPFVVYPGAVPSEVCDALCEEVEDMPHGDGQVGGELDAPIRDASVAFLPPTHWSAELLHHAAAKANEEGRWNYELLGPEAVQHTRYGPQQHYGWHVDAFGDQDAVRKLSITLQLSHADAYTGGELEFLRFGVATPEVWGLPEAARARGSLIVFPSFLVHRVTAVQRGRRDALVAWIRGPRFR